MENRVSETQADEQSQSKHDREQPSAQWKKTFSGAWQDFSPRYFSNLLFLVIGLLVAPAVGVIVNKPKIVIAGFALGVTILIWVGAILLMKHAGQTSGQEPPSVSDAETTRRINTPAIPQGEPNPEATTPKAVKPLMPEKEKLVMTDEKPTHPKQKQGNVNANINIQSGRDTHVYPPPVEPPLPVSEIRYYVEKLSSPNVRFQYGLEITIQTTVPIRAGQLTLEFDTPIGDAIPPGFKVSGNIVSAFVGGGFKFHGNVYEFSFDGFIGQEFGPQHPLVLRVYGTHPLKLIKQRLAH